MYKRLKEEREAEFEKLKSDHEKMIASINENNDKQMEKKQKEHDRAI